MQSPMGRLSVYVMVWRVSNVPSWCLAFSWLQIIYANPCKAPAHIRFARDRGVHLMTFDNEDELHKVRQFPSHRVICIW
jgi:diaminopimelate decarboxylase